MIAVSIRRPNQSRLSRRAAFTLLEVMVVVAIIVVLASVASIAVLGELERAKDRKAEQDMMALEKVYKMKVLESGGNLGPDNFQIGILADRLEQGSASFNNPYGTGQYQFRFVPGESGDMRIQFYTTNPKGVEINWPRY
jgi:general secretion pathway protein G